MSNGKPDDNLMKRFVNWCAEKEIRISSSAEVTNQGCCHRFGMIAKRKINKSEVIFTIPRFVLNEVHH